MKFAPALKQAGITRLNVSLDSLQPERFATITGGGKLDAVFDGLLAAKGRGLCADQDQHGCDEGR